MDQLYWRNLIADACQRGNKIELIKLYRDVTGAGLKESKDAIETVIPSGVSVTGSDQGAYFKLFEGLSVYKKSNVEQLTPGIAVLAQSWKELGYKSLVDAVTEFIKRLEIDIR